MLEYIPHFDYNLPTILFFGFALFALIQLIYVVVIYGRVAFHRQKTSDQVNYPPVSIIIAARNESENLYEHLPFILDQDYPEFEVIVVNHQSIDDSQYVLQAYQLKHPNLKVIPVERNAHLGFGKKLPLTLGIKGSEHEHLLFTDADCLPTSNQWIKSMTANFTEKKQIVLGYGPYKKEKGLLNRTVRFDTTWIAMSYLSFAKSGMPYMGVGRNLAYTKTSFDSCSGYKSHYALPSGDDDLFIQEAAKKRNYTINIDPASFSYSSAPSSWETLFRQKSRHYTTSPRYQVFKKLMLGIYPFSLQLLLISFVILLFDSEFIWISLATFLLLLIVKWIILGKAFKKLEASSFIPGLPLLDILYAFWTPILFYAISKKDETKW